MMVDFRQLIYVFEDARRFLSRLENDYSYSSWEDNNGAKAEIDGILMRLRAGELPSTEIIFAPTGPMQEVALSSDWGGEFLELANRFDEAMRQIRSECVCLSQPTPNMEIVKELGMDKLYAEVALLRCSKCGRDWIRYHYENEAFTASGRWFLGLLEGTAPTVGQAREWLEGLDWYFCGGSFFYGKVGKGSGPIFLNP